MGRRQVQETWVEKMRLLVDKIKLSFQNDYILAGLKLVKSRFFGLIPLEQI